MPKQLKPNKHKNNSIQHNPNSMPNINGNTKLSQSQAVLTAYSGPLPPPEILEKYKEIYPDAPAIIFDTFKKQSEHRMSLEKKVINAGSLNSTLGIIFLLYNKIDLPGYTTLIFGLGSLVGIFIYGKKSNKAERTQRRT